MDVERCKQDMLDAELIRKTLLSFDKVVNSLPIEDRKDLFQLLIRQITVWSFDPAKEKAPKELGAFVTKIRTRWFKIKLELYQFPEIEAYYRSIREKKASSDFHKNWLPDRGKYPNFSIKLIVGLNNAKNGSRWSTIYPKDYCVAKSAQTNPAPCW